MMQVKYLFKNYVIFWGGGGGKEPEFVFDCWPHPVLCLFLVLVLFLCSRVVCTMYCYFLSTRDHQIIFSHGGAGIHGWYGTPAVSYRQGVQSHQGSL